MRQRLRTRSDELLPLLRVQSRLLRGDYGCVRAQEQYKSGFFIARAPGGEFLKSIVVLSFIFTGGVERRGTSIIDFVCDIAWRN